MFKVKLSLADMNVLAKIAKAKQVVTDMTGNASYATPFPALADITTAADELEVARKKAEEGGKGTASAMHEKEKVVDSLLTAESHYVDYQSNGVESVIISSGFEARSTHASHLPKPNPPFAVEAISKMNAGELLIRFKTDVKSLLYLAERTNASTNGNVPTDTWTKVGLSSRKSLLVKDLTAGAYYGFRVAAISPSGQSDWSEIAVGKVAF